MTDNFLQNSLILLENQQNIQSTLLNIISSLSIIKNRNFGIKCMRTLNDLMNSGEDMFEIVKITLIKNIIPNLRQSDLYKIYSSNLGGLVLIINTHDCNEIFKPPFPFLKNWIFQVKLINLVFYSISDFEFNKKKRHIRS